MPANKPTRKSHKKGRVYDPLLKTQMWRLNAVFNPLLAIIEQLESSGTKDVASDGTAIFKDAVDGHWYDSSVAITGVAEAYEIHEKRAGVVINLEPLHRLAKKLQYDMVIFPSDTRDCRACFTRMHAASLNMTIGYARELIRDTQIQEQVEKLLEAA